MRRADEPGLRERKRLATRRAIQLAVLRLAVDRSPEKVTVEDVSHAADISPRTFFNYFPTKEAALAGDPFELPSAAEVEAFVTAGPSASLLRGLGELLASSAENASHDVELQLLRKMLLKRHPQLLVTRMAVMRGYEEQLAGLVAERLAKDDPALSGDPARLQSTARLVTLVAFGAMRHAWTLWSDSGGSVPLADGLRSAFEQLERILPPVRPQ
ncbi:MAG: TetR family transcriptional regulator [Microbacteriaceae bacterium]